MYGATFALVVNTLVAGLFAASFTVIALANPSSRRALWFAASYAVGMLTPFSLLVMPYSQRPFVYGALNYASFSGGLFLMTGALASFYGKRPRWLLVAWLFGASLANGWMISGWPSDTLFYNLDYQMPFIVAVALSGGVILSASRAALDLALAGMYGLLAVHFVIKSFLAVSFGVGRFPDGYVGSIYALISQSATGVLLIGTGLLTLLIVAQSAIADARRAAETDQLTGLLNRRGFDLHCARRLARARSQGDPASVMILDLDHFKRINDQFGHPTGDEVLRAFAASLRRVLPPSAVVGRMGGEEFVVFLNGARLETVQTIAETIRGATSVIEHLPPITVSIGVAGVMSGETFSDAMRRADKALYEAKETGRNKVCIAA